MLQKKILVVDDEPVVRDLCVRILRHHGFDSITSSNGMEGLEAYTERHDEIALVLSDISMPLMDGVALSRKLFEMHSHANVILMSGHNLVDLVPDEVRRLCSVLKKPFTPAGLVEAVKKCLRYEEEHHPDAASN